MRPSPALARSTYTASSCTWVSRTTETCMPAAMASNLMLEPVSQPGSRGAKNPGTGLEPTTLSTAIFNGTGPSSMRGVAIKPSRNIPMMWGQ